MRRIALAISALLTLSACDDGHDYTPAPNYCEAEGRQIPDVELKARMLTALYQNWYATWPGPTPSHSSITMEMAGYLSEQGLSPTSSKAAIQEVFARFIEAHPLCCQFAVKEIWDKEKNPKLLPDQYDLTRNYFANLYLLDHPYYKIPDAGRSAAGVSLPLIKRNGVTTTVIYKIFRAYNCGYAWPLD